MQALHRTRSQHFVSSPRKTTTPLKHKLLRHSSKRRRLGSNSTAFAPLPSNSASSDEEHADRPSTPAGQGRPKLTRKALSSEAGRSSSRSRSRSTRAVGNRAKEKDDWREGADDVFTSGEDGLSPKKRKRGVKDPDTRSDTSSSWVELDEDEEEPEFIAESDQHLLQDAPMYALQRLRKAELVRLWKVAGMWSEDDGDGSVISVEDEMDGGLSKKELVDGLIAARRLSLDRRISTDDSPKPSPLRRSTLEAGFDTMNLRSASSSFPPSIASSSSGPHTLSKDIDSTPRAAPRTRARTHKNETSLLRSVQRRPNGPRPSRPRENLFRTRSKSLGGEERKARFGDDVKSPGKALVNRRARRASTQSSAYTTTDTSPPADPPPTRRISRRPSRHFANNDKRSRSRVGFKPSESVEIVEYESTDESDGEVNPTPLVQRLRSRTRSSFTKEASSEVDADGEEESEIDQNEDSPIFSRRTRSRDKIVDSESPTRDIQRRNSRLLPDRGAKRKAIEALKGGESDDEEMDVEEAVELDEEEAPASGRITRSQQRAQEEEEVVEDMNDAEGAEELEEDEDDADTSRERMSVSLTPSPPSEDEMETEETDSVEQPRENGTTRNRKGRMRQDATGDSDTQDTDDDTDVSVDGDVDLADATHASLVRLLRDELVQMCEARGIEVGGTKPQLAQALLDWRDEQNQDRQSTTSSQSTARPSSSSKKIIHAVASNVHVSGKTTPVLLRDHIHASDPATPPHSTESKKAGEAELNLDLSELGLEDSIIKPSQLQKLEKIGSGGFKDVYVGKLRGRKVAISEFREELSEMDIRELKLLAEFSHPNIVKFRGICIPEDNSQVPCMLVSELCENGDLFDYIRNVPCPPLKRVLGLMLDIARGLEYLHTRQPAIIHRDCKSSNILINRAGQAKVGDFGLARVKHSTRSMIRSLVGTVNWQAPELWHPSPRYDYKVDVFSAAVVYWEMMSGWIGEKKYPWEGHNEHYIYDAVGAKHRRPSVAGLRKHWGAEPVNLMERMWHQDPGERPTMTDVVVDLEVLIAECK